MQRALDGFKATSRYLGSDWQQQPQARSELHRVWDALQCLQTDFCFKQELSTYYTDVDWHDAKTVLDVGTGNGYYLQGLAGLFPDKIYTGTDLESEYIELAEARNENKDVALKVGNLFELEGQYDFVIARLVMQHLYNPVAALEQLGRLLRPGGNALIIDALDKSRYFHPVPREYVRFFDSYRGQQLEAGMDRNVASQIGSLLRGHPLLRQQYVHELVIPSSIPGNLELFDNTYYLVISMLELSGRMDYDFERAKRDWLAWCELPNRYMQVGLRMVKVHRNYR